MVIWPIWNALRLDDALRVALMTEAADGAPAVAEIVTVTPPASDSIWTRERALPAVVLGVIDVLALRGLVADIWTAGVVSQPADLLALLNRVVYLAFVTLMIVLFVTRPPARSKDSRVSSWLFAVIGTFGLAITPLLPAGPTLVHTGIVGAVGSSIVSVVAMSTALVALRTLGRSFSIAPQARNLVSSGPYRMVRHPLYLAEALAIMAVALASGRANALFVLVVVLACQVRRSQLEERLLTRTFPEYPAVFEGVPHFLPGIY